MDSAVLRVSGDLLPAVKEHLAGGGKHVRAGILLAAAAACGAPEGTGLAGAAAIELVHNFSLVHDDIIDRDTERRHRPTLWAEHGIGHAIIAGDALVALAFQVLLDEPTPERVAASRHLALATQEMIAGQAEDMASEQRESISVEECVHMGSGKTGALLSCAAGMGATLAGAPVGTVEALSDFGCHLGIAFQAIDDVLGIWGESDVTGKPVGNDLRQHKKTLPVALALAQEGDIPDRLAVLLGKDLSDDDVMEATVLLERCGAREGAMAMGDAELGLSLACLDRVSLEPGPKSELIAIARYVTARDR
jgi:geranylgeranyl diphosphate synthase type I